MCCNYYSLLFFIFIFWWLIYMLLLLKAKIILVGIVLWVIFWLIRLVRTLYYSLSVLSFSLFPESTHSPFPQPGVILQKAASSWSSWWSSSYKFWKWRCQHTMPAALISLWSRSILAKMESLLGLLLGRRACIINHRGGHRAFANLIQAVSVWRSYDTNWGCWPEKVVQMSFCKIFLFMTKILKWLLPWTLWRLPLRL